MHFTLTEIIRLLIERDETLSVAESCTGGGLANVITSEPGVSEVFTGSVTAYADSAKEAVLLCRMMRICVMAQLVKR